VSRKQKSRRREIDWQAVEFVVQGERLQLTADEKKMVIRRVAHRMIDNDDRLHNWRSQSTAAKITAVAMAGRMMTSERSAQRIKDELRPADKRTCPVCREPMWVYDDGTIEAHPNRLMDECELSGTVLPPPVRGLAALRPDLFRWLPAVTS
jgi:hypothetical protein